MNIWRPRQNIEVKALGLVWRDGLLLASEICRDDGTVDGVRPLGGRVEFGETWCDALVREFREELGVVVEVVGTPMVLENIYMHQGMVGHEVAFVCDVTFPADAYVSEGPIEYFEDNGDKCLARWYDVAQLDCGALELYPTGLKTQLRERSQST
ncbi:NUDIX hydrolase [Roseobacter litoralis]|uniref:NUDIX hydrolase-like protein n=1 Tax=Roseobacter litoralis (strain ATCC 49566 / DSM 6996 / JCM 21268 / NBRC 15278 / OCh 149) TaxID=391595 RepID=F7ZAM0_ROSLO|nr:NUDIX domain-containing protein [Roseobacter litoralis]AEI94216.1 NUDIX hydrolase-like protein [Roseobacter litoralis Och 149]